MAIGIVMKERRRSGEVETPYMEEMGWMYGSNKHKAFSSYVDVIIASRKESRKACACSQAAWLTNKQEELLYLTLDALFLTESSPVRNEKHF